MSDYGDICAEELKEKPICRFCLAQDKPLTNIYSNENSQNSRVSLAMQIMACVSIEVFSNDDMPSTICNPCRLLMGYCYSFKQMCKKADTLLKQFPLTGVWPDPINHPAYPEELIKNVGLVNQKGRLTAQALKRKLPQSITIISPAAKKATPIIKAEEITTEEQIENMIVEFAEEANMEMEDVKPTALLVASPLPPPKILNKTNVKILNKQAPGKRTQPMLRPPVIKTNEDGNIEIVSEIIEADETEIDPLKNAVPVETNVFPCNYCERSFPLRQLLDIHLANHVRDRKFHCEICQRGFFSKYDLGKHVLIHTGERPFQCVVCKKAFSRSTLLRRHEKIHSDQPKLLCGFCERSFLSKNEWEKHIQNHQKRRPFECDICGKSFAFKQGLERHEIVHKADQPYKCEHCDLGFSTQGKLARHLTAHAGDRPYPCRLCEKSYLLSHHLTRHMRSHKENLGSYKCIECDSEFTKRDELIFHSAVHATENLKCPLCKELFESVDDVTEHIKLHTDGEQYACEFCDSIFLTEIRLQNHCEEQHLEEIEMYETGENENFEVVEEVIVNEDDMEKSESSQEENEMDEPTVSTDEDANKTSSAKKTATLRSYGKSGNKPKASDVKLEKSPSDNIKAFENTSKPKAVTKLQVNSAAERKSDRKVADDSKANAIAVNKLLSNTRPVAIASTTATKKRESVNSSTTPSAVKASFSTPKSEKKQESPQNKILNTRAITNKLSPNTATATSSAAKATAVTTAVKKSPQTLAMPTKTAPIKPKPNEITKTGASTTPAGANKKALPVAASTSNATNEDHIKMGDKMVKVQHVRMTKSQFDAMRKEGKIEIRDGKIVYTGKVSATKK